MIMRYKSAVYDTRRCIKFRYRTSNAKNGCESNCVNYKLDSNFSSNFAVYFMSNLMS